MEKPSGLFKIKYFGVRMPGLPGWIISAMI